MVVKSIEEMFPDWQEIPLGEWSKYGKIIAYVADKKVEVGLYHEPLDSGEYADTYTLQIFDGDEVIFCHQVEF